MNLYIIAITGLSAGWAATLYAAWHYAGKADEMETDLKREIDRAADWEYLFTSITNRLTALRANCFLTNEKGHRVRYSKASEALRERAEGN